MQINIVNSVSIKDSLSCHPLLQRPKCSAWPSISFILWLIFPPPFNPALTPVPDTQIIFHFLLCARLLPLPSTLLSSGPKLQPHAVLDLGSPSFPGLRPRAAQPPGLQSTFPAMQLQNQLKMFEPVLQGIELLFRDNRPKP